MTSLDRAFAGGINVFELVVSEALRPGQWLHRDGVMFVAPDVLAAAERRFPAAKHGEAIGVMSNNVRYSTP